MVLGLLVIRKLSLGKQQMAAVVFVVGIGMSLHAARVGAGWRLTCTFRVYSDHSVGSTL